MGAEVHGSWGAGVKRAPLLSVIHDRAKEQLSMKIHSHAGFDRLNRCGRVEPIRRLSDAEGVLSKPRMGETLSRLGFDTLSASLRALNQRR